MRDNSATRRAPGDGHSGCEQLPCVFLALYAFGVFGYVTATLATYFVGREAESGEAELAGSRELTALREELIALRGDIRTLSQRSLGP
jgi:voltage-gated potassium channel